MLIFISGGVRSGKSAVAENMAIRALHADGRLLYVACGQRIDKEMDSRIFHHQERRRNSGYRWTTVEQPVDIESIPFKAGDTVLIDCVTTLLAGEFFREDKPSSEAGKRITEGIFCIEKKVRAVVVVSNELSFEYPVPGLTADYMETLGLIHQRLAEKSDAAVLVEHGISIVKKGEMLCVE